MSLNNEKVTAAIADMAKHHKAYGYVKYPNPIGLYEWIYEKHRLGETSQVGGYLIMWEVITPPWAHDKVLQEQLVIWLGPDRYLTRVDTELVRLAQLYKCDTIATGDSSIDRRMGALYSKHRGYTPNTTLYYKDVPHGQDHRQVNRS